MTLTEQIDRLIEAGLAELSNLGPDELVRHAARLSDEPGAIIAVHPSLVPAAQLATLLRHNNKPGFVVSDMTDLEHFAPIAHVAVPKSPLYLIHDIDRGDRPSTSTANENR
jgi:hypothetical protein